MEPGPPLGGGRAEGSSIQKQTATIAIVILLWRYNVENQCHTVVRMVEQKLSIIIIALITSTVHETCMSHV